MKEFTTLTHGGFAWCKGHERILVIPWGKNGVRIRVTKEADFRLLPNGLLDEPETPEGAAVDISDDGVTLVHGEITVTLTRRLGQLTFLRTSDGQELLKERHKTTAEYLARTFIPGKGTWKIEQRFFADDAEKLYGLGQRQHGYLDQKGCVLDLMHRNTEVSIPFMISSKGYGFLWNHPGVGRVDLGRNDTRWVAEAAHQLDYYVVIDDSPAKILRRYAEVTGFPSEFPGWASGFWQCKLRYKTQEELLEVAREYHRRDLPVSVMVIDFHHWTKSGDWSFDPDAWPDPSAMVKELKSMGMELMVSVWPTVDYSCENFAHMRDHGLVIRNERGVSLQNGASLETFYDATNPEARKFLWEQIRKGYVEHGIKLFWLDTIEPEIIPLEQDNTRYHLGNGLEVSGLYPLCHQQGFFEGLKSEGETAPLTLGRSAWVGSQRFGAAVWSADIPSTFDSLRRQVAAGLNIALSGVPWWTTDIGGFHGGDIDDPGFRELLVRWFQYGVFCPIMRLHGVRRQKNARIKPGDPIANPNHPNVPNEVWSYGEETCRILSDQIRLRERLRPYIMGQMKVAQETGMPPMRPLFVDFPADPTAWQVEDQFMFGPDIMVAPIVVEGDRSRSVYLPAGKMWRDAWTGAEHEGGSTSEADAPLERIPVYLRGESELDLR
ncbi:MAG: glycoside hydrolase family 31 protein [Kiritimatiellia bacterium]|jgi:alpha-D-xyloside xylohydrolase|nr:glycoside hydrolase family 31 protein [Kiritimatiellia bacterium]